MSKILGIDASTVASGGGERHLIELLNNFHLNQNEFDRIMVWGVDSLLNQLPNELDDVHVIVPQLIENSLYYL